MFLFQGTPTKTGETPSKKVEKKTGDKENIYQPLDEDDVNQPSSIVNETFKMENDSNIVTFMQLSDQVKEAIMPSSDIAIVGDDKYSSIALLDDQQEDEKWEERTAVITKNDHEEYVAAAEAIIYDLISGVKTPVKRYFTSSYALMHFHKIVLSISAF